MQEKGRGLAGLYPQALFIMRMTWAIIMSRITCAVVISIVINVHD